MNRQMSGMRKRAFPSWKSMVAIAVGAVLLVVMFVTSTAMATEQSGASWADEIDVMLDSADYVEGQAIAAFKVSEDDLRAQSVAPYDIDPIMEVGASALQGVADEGILFAQSSDRVTLSLVSSNTLSTEELLLALADDPNVAFAEPNYLDQLDRDASVSDAQAQATAELTAQAVDPSLIGDITPLQWNFWTTSQTSRTNSTAENPSINVPAFGSSEKGANMDQEVLVALVDDPADFNNPDLASVVYHFTSEQQQALGCWEWGYNAVGGGVNGNVLDQEALDMGHGTHTAGIIGAAWDGHGLSGVASNVRIVSIQLPNAEGVESMGDALVAYAFINRFNEQAPEGERIRVVNNSWSQYISTRALSAAVREVGETWGIVSVFSAGNGGKNNDYYEKTPSTFVDNPYAIVVANSTVTDQLETSSEYGEATVDLAAPGSNILSTLPIGLSRYYADAGGSTNLAYEGFDDGTSCVTVTQMAGTLDERDRIPVGELTEVGEVGTVVSQAHFFGDSSLKIDLDPAYVIPIATFDSLMDFYLLNLTFDISKDEVDSQIDEDGSVMFGVAVAADYEERAGVTFAGTNVTKGYFYDVSMTDASAVTWGTYSIKITPEGVGPSDEEDDSLDGLGYATEDVPEIAIEDEVQIAVEDEIVSEVEDTDEAPTAEVTEAELQAAATDDRLVVTLILDLPQGCSSIYLDSIGIGTLVFPYDYRGGTSMAAPAVAGATAVLASEGYEGAELASLVRSKVRIPDAGALPVKTGGIFDFNVAGSPDDGTAESLAPDISSLSLEGTTLTIAGSNFGSKQGVVELSKYVVGTDPSPVSASVVSWGDDQIVLALDDSFKGVVQAVVTNVAGKFDTWNQLLSKSENVYEQDLPIDTSTGDPFVFDGLGDWDTEGPLVGLGCKLYYLPGYAPNHDAKDLAHRRMLCFDLKTQTWSELPELPEWLYGASAVMYDGTIVVEGSTMYLEAPDRPTSSFPIGESAEERVYVYDPEKQTWTQASSEGMYLGQTIMNDGGQLKLAGGALPTDPDTWQSYPAPVMLYDLATGAGEAQCDLPVEEYEFLTRLAYDMGANPQAVAKDGTILIYSSFIYDEGHHVVVRIQGDQATVIDLPDFFYAAEGEPEDGGAWGVVRIVHFGTALATAKDGFVLVGPPAADGSTDTYILYDGSDTFEPYEKRASDGRVFGPAACVYRGRLFVIGASWFEPNQRLFRATPMEAPEYPGDIPCDPEPEPEPSPTPKPTPKPSPSERLPQTGDVTDLGMIALLAGAGLALVVFGRASSKLS